MGIKILESIQRRTKLVKRVVRMSSEERLRILSLVEQRKLTSNLISLYSFLRRSEGRGDNLFSGRKKGVKGQKISSVAFETSCLGCQ